MMNAKEIQRRMDIAVALAREAGKLALKYFQRDLLSVETKANGTPVSEADKAAEEFLRERLLKEFPGEALIGEEHGSEGGGDAVWILDPIDGTESFVRGVPLFGNLIGLEVRGEMLVGVANMPGINEVVYAGRGLGAWWANRDHDINSPRRARVSATPSLGAAMTCFSGANYFRQTKRLSLFGQLMQKSGNSRGWGDCYGHILVATGRADAAVDPLMEIWDSAALLPIVREAGGEFTDFSGRHDIRGRSAVSTNGVLHAEYLELIRMIGTDD